MNIEALIFDMDGLIFDSERIVQRSWNMAGEELGYGKIGEHIYNTLGFNVVRRKMYFKSVFGQDFPMEDFNRITRQGFWDIVEAEGIAIKTGAKELMEYGKKNGLKIVIATSSRREYATKLLTEEGIMPYLDGCVFGDMVTHAKPDPEIYLKAAEIAQTEPEKCLALEDAPSGIRSCYAAGMKPVMVPDLAVPTQEILDMLYYKADTLLDVIPLLEEN